MNTSCLPLRMRGLCSAAASLLLGCATLFAGELVADRDTYVFGGEKPIDPGSPVIAAEANFGARRLLEVKTSASKSDGYTRKAYLGFDLTSLPKSAAPLSLRFSVREAVAGQGADQVLGEQPVILYLVKASVHADDWLEGAGDIGEKTENGASTGSLHWLNAPANARKLGNRVAPRETVEAGRVIIPADVGKNQVFKIALTPAALAELRATRSPARATFILTIGDGTDDLLRVHSREAPAAALRPALVW